MTEKPPPRRVSMTVTGYLIGHLGGFYDLTSRLDGTGDGWSIPEFAVDESSIADAPPETLTAFDWAEIRGTVAARYGDERADRIVAKWLEWATAFDQGGWS